MTAASPIPVRQPAIDRWAELDAEDDLILERYLSGEHDRDRRIATDRAAADARSVPDLPVDELAARKRADEAVGGLIRKGGF